MEHDIRQNAIQALDEILAPDHAELVRFGAGGEPLRLSQLEGLTAIKTALNEGAKLGHIVQPGGGGKTRMATVLAHAMHRHGRNTLFIVPSQTALEDFVKKTRALCPDLDVGAVYQGEKRIGRLTFITYASLLARVLGEEALPEPGVEIPKSGASLRINPADFDLLVWDEAHMYLTENAKKLLGKFGHAINVGMTATPRYYEGKEVSEVFGPCWQEVMPEKAKERGEVSDWENIRIDTDIATGIELSSPEQEESAQVGRALNRPGRNLIVADLYKNGEIFLPRTGKTHALAGEPSIVFGAGIDHVNDMARQINEALMPALKSDEAFRAALRAKGIDPDRVEAIAEPIHAGATDHNESMSRNVRNRLIDRYRQRKVLMLVATSVLQQSFDDQATSVIFDTVPRQTFVGVGQAGMRATRRHPKKDMAFIFNFEDADHPTLTFDDFAAARAQRQEEGLRVVIAGKSGKEREHLTSTPDEEGKTAAYRITGGEELQRQLARRRQLRQNMPLDTYRYFPPETYSEIARLMDGIRKGNTGAADAFLKIVRPVLERIRFRVAEKIFGDRLPEEEMLDDFAANVLTGNPARIDDGKWHGLLGALREGNIATWSQFQSAFQGNFLKSCEAEAARREKNGGIMQPLNAKTWRRRYGEKNPLTGEHAANAVHHAITSGVLSDREKIIITRHLAGTSLEDIAKPMEIGKERVRQIKIGGMEKMRAVLEEAGDLREWEGAADPEKANARYLARKYGQCKNNQEIRDYFRPYRQKLMDVLISCLPENYFGFDDVYRWIASHTAFSESSVKACFASGHLNKLRPIFEMEQPIAEAMRTEGHADRVPAFQQAVADLRRAFDAFQPDADKGAER